jgi:hypothetical protein
MKTNRVGDHSFGSRERLLRIPVGLAIAGIAALTVFPAWAAENAPTHHHRHHAHHVTQTAPAPVVQQPAQAAESWPVGSMFKQYARPGEGDNDGLSFNPDDCMKGCIGGDPR